jgi:hypothetical protein
MSHFSPDTARQEEHDGNIDDLSNHSSNWIRCDMYGNQPRAIFTDSGFCILRPFSEGENMMIMKITALSSGNDLQLTQGCLQ